MLTGKRDGTDMVGDDSNGKEQPQQDFDQLRHAAILPDRHRLVNCVPLLSHSHTIAHISTPPSTPPPTPIPHPAHTHLPTQKIGRMIIPYAITPLYILYKTSVILFYSFRDHIRPKTKKARVCGGANSRFLLHTYTSLEIIGESPYTAPCTDAAQPILSCGDHCHWWKVVDGDDDVKWLVDFLRVLR